MNQRQPLQWNVASGSQSKSCHLAFEIPTDAPATVETLMDRVLAGLSLTTALVYIDDILVPAKSFEQGI